MIKSLFEWAGPNHDLVSQIDDYCYGKNTVPFALMLHGKWGTGKTYLVRRFFKDKRDSMTRTGEFPKTIYISLYGLKSTEEIAYALYAAMHTFLESKAGRLAISAAKGLLKSAVKIDLPEFHKLHGQVALEANNFLPDNKSNQKSDTGRNYKRRPIIFDDIERAKLPVSDVLAFIQPLVETGENRVLVIANEDEIARDDEAERKRYELIKEKTIYLTLEVQPHIGSAWEEALEILSEGKFRAFLTRKKEEFIAFLSGITEHNLRLLSFFMYFGDKLFSAIDARYIAGQYDEGLLHIFKTLYTLLIEQCVYGLSVSEIKQKYNINNNKNNDKNSFYLSSSIIKLSTLSYLLKKGVLEEDINEYLFRSSFFYIREKTSSSLRLTMFEQSSEEEIKKDIQDFRTDFDKRSFSKNDIVEVFSVYQTLSRLGVDGFDKKTEQETLKKYIEDTIEKYEANDFNPFKYIEDEWYKIFYEYYENKISFLEIENKNKVIEDIKTRTERVNFILDNMKYNKESLLNNVCFLKELDAEKFIQDIFKCEDKMSGIQSYLVERFRNICLPSHELHGEYQWFQNFMSILEQRITSLQSHPLHKEKWRIWLKSMKGYIESIDNKFFIETQE